jgi:histidinol-phosphate/aromatic aminotransferase/cobyric acid decarboxylase-like protein
VVEQEKPKCIFLTSPNNPDGRYIFVIHKWSYTI